MDIRVKVIPRSSASEVAGTMDDGTLRVKVRAVPEKGRANQEVCEVLARHFGVPPSNVSVIGGASSSQKRIRILK